MGIKCATITPDEARVEGTSMKLWMISGWHYLRLGDLVSIYSLIHPHLVQGVAKQIKQFYSQNRRITGFLWSSRLIEVEIYDDVLIEAIRFELKVQYLYSLKEPYEFLKMCSWKLSSL